MNAIAVVEDEVRELVRRRGLDPVADPSAVRRLVDEVIADYDERSLGGNLPQLVDLRVAARQVFDVVAGFGPLQKYFDDPTVEEIWINSLLSHGSALSTERGDVSCWVRAVVGSSIRRPDTMDGRQLSRASVDRAVRTLCA